MLLPRAPESQELQEVYTFLNKHLRQEQQWSVVQEYPLAFDPKNQHNIRIITDETGIVSHAVLKPTILKTPYAIFNAGMIGSVMTDPRFRNQGLSANLIENCLDQARVLRCDFAILWTDLFEFYRKFGFELAGCEISLILNDNFKPSHRRSDLKIIEGKQIDPNAIMRLFHLHSTHSLRTAEDIKKFLNIPNSRIYTAWNANNQMEAYAIEGKGVDLQGYVHEWGGNTSALIELFQHIREEQKKEIIVMVPSQSKNLLRQCTEAGAQRFEGILGMIKIIDKKNLARKTQKIARRMGIQDFAIEVHTDENGIEVLYFGTSEGMYKTDSEADMVQLFFGPQKPSEIYPFSEVAAEKLNRVLPLPIWVWGWDSI
jgi:predicted N-acetyltransferase YhbS